MIILEHVHLFPGDAALEAKGLNVLDAMHVCDELLEIVFVHLMPAHGVVHDLYG